MEGFGNRKELNNNSLKILIENISVSDVPLNAMNYFEGSSARFILPENYKKGNFENFFIIKHENGDLTYIANQKKNGEYNTYFFNTRNGEEIGHGEVRFLPDSESDFYRNKPFVGFTDTEEDFRRQGLGKRRLMEMGEYSKKEYGLPLYSDTLISQESKKVWENLVEVGLAEKFTEKVGNENKERYVLLV